MSNGVILLLVILASAFVYFVVFNEGKKYYPEEKIKKIFDNVLDLITPNEDDHKIMIIKKKNLESK